MARIGLGLLAGVFLLAEVASAQVNEYQEGQPGAAAQAQIPQAGPQPVGPTPYPAAQQYVPSAIAPAQVPAAQQQPIAPPQFATGQQAEVARVLQTWEQSTRNIRTFECSFTRTIFNAAAPLGPDGKPDLLVHQGVMKYAAPDKGLFQIDGNRPEKWICDGKSIYEYKSERKQVLEYPIPPSQQGQAIADGPLPFMFGARAEKLNGRYLFEILPRQANAIFLRAFPRFREDAGNFSCVLLKLEERPNGSLQLAAVRIFEPSGQNYTQYEFVNPAINFKDPLEFIRGPFFRAPVSLGWQRVVQQSNTSANPTEARQAQRP